MGREASQVLSPPQLSCESSVIADAHRIRDEFFNTIGPYATVTIAQSRRLAECVTRFKSIATLNQTFNYYGMPHSWERQERHHIFSHSVQLPKLRKTHGLPSLNHANRDRPRCSTS